MKKNHLSQDISNGELREKPPVTKRFLSKLFTAVPKEYRSEFNDALLETNINRARSLSIYIIFIQILLNIINALLPSETASDDILIYIYLSMATLCIGIIYLILFTLVKHNKIRRRGIKIFLVQSILYIYLAIQFVFATLNISSLGNFYSYIIALLIIGMFPILTPKQSVPTITIMLTYIFYTIYRFRENTEIWEAVFATDVWTNLIIMTIMIMAISVFIYNMFVSNFLQSIELKNANSDLESTVLERTKELEEQTKTAQIASQAKGDFLARMSHEIRTPLNAIIGMTYVAKKAESKTDTENAINQIETASSHLLDLVNDILDMSKIEAGQLELVCESISLSDTMKEIISSISPRCKERGINFIADVSSIPKTAVLGDKMRLKQILFNLLDNSIKFTPEGGKITFSAKCTDDSEKRESILFSVNDEGIGISSDKIDDLFNAFEQTDKTIATNYGGTGLGLSISQNLVEQMGGKIEVDSRVGKGSNFYFELDFEKDFSPIRAVTVSTLDSLDFTGKTMLLAEDIEINRVIISELLKDTNLNIEEAVDGVEAVKMFEESPLSYYDLIFMDIQMPNMNGYDATNKIRAMQREDSGTIPIIAMTANAYKEDIDKSRAAGMNEHLAKPIMLDRLMEILSEYLK